MRRKNINVSKYHPLARLGFGTLCPGRNLTQPIPFSLSYLYRIGTGVTLNVVLYSLEYSILIETGNVFIHLCMLH